MLFKNALKMIAALPVLMVSSCTGSDIRTTASASYSVELQSSDFVSIVNNPYFPLRVGSTWTYEAMLADGSVERNVVEVLEETHTVKGVEATVVHDVVYQNDQLIEETYDWYAQDRDGNVWYLGEEVDNYENGQLVDHAGSWEWGVDGALPGVIMWAAPSEHLNEEYYQEYYAGEAEDQGKVVGVNESVTIPFGSYSGVVKTYDFSALDPELQEFKYYAEGVGLVKEINQVAGEEVVLVEFTGPTE